MDRTPTPDTVTGFASLFQGGSMAQSLTDGGFFPMENPDGTFYPATGDAYQNAVEGHLKREGESIGVYPLMAVHDPEGVLQGFTVWWGCVDWDEGREESLVHARNTHEVLAQIGITGWVERSRSKGFHLWVFFTEPLPARIVRDGLMGVCNVVGAPTKEVNPKQTSLVGKKIGNGMRLPYPALREPGQHEMLNPKALYSQIPLADSFVASALETRVTAHQWEAAHALYKKNEPEPVRRASYSYTGSRLTGLAAAIRRNGPRVTADKPHGDRSGTLFSLACNMIRQGYGDGDISKELRDADNDWGGKYAKRPDGGNLLDILLTAAHKEAWSGNEKFLN
tara:strand:- start:870 stop:1880 length:1011 start_codon:yes stop_codon:yes gene_type:complete